jgi:glycosyltransferase involved in cell wall biosynthesis
MTQPPLRLLIPFAAASLYGMERSVIEVFDLLRPNIAPHFLVSRTLEQHKMPLLAEIRRRHFDYSFFSDTKPWPKIQRPKSFKHLMWMLTTLVIGNWDVLRASKGHDAIYLPGLSYVYYALPAIILFRAFGKRVLYRFHDLILHRSFALRLVSYFVTDYIHYCQTGFELVAAPNVFIRKRRNHVLAPRIERRASDSMDRNIESEMAGFRNVLFLGQVSRHKGVDLLIDAAELLTKKYPNIRLHIVGAYGTPSGEMSSKLQASPVTRFWGFQNDTRCFFKHVELLVLPSPPSRFLESFGRVIIEANEAGVPAIAFRGGVMQDVIHHGKTGLLCEEESALSLADAIDRLLSDEDFRRSCGDNARRLYSDVYSDARIRATWLEQLLVLSSAT